MADSDDHDRGIRNEEAWHANIDKWIAHEEAQRQSWVAHAQVHELEAQALRLQHTEYFRRLDDLNHARAQAQARNADYLPREVYETGQREVISRAELLAETANKAVTREVLESELNARDAQLDILIAWKNKATGAVLILTLFAGALGAGLAKIIGG